MSNRNEEFAKAMGYKISSIPMRSNKFRKKCVDCGNNVFANEGAMVKGEEHDKIKTVCSVCSEKWLSKEDVHLDTYKLKERHLNGYKPLDGK